MPRTVTLNDDLEESLRWFRTRRARFLEACAKAPNGPLDDNGEDACDMMQQHAIDFALAVAEQLGDVILDDSPPTPMPCPRCNAGELRREDNNPPRCTSAARRSTRTIRTTRARGGEGASHGWPIPTSGPTAMG